MTIKIVKIQKPILKAGVKNFRFLSSDSLWAYHPCVIERNGEYYMFYTGKSIGKGIKHNSCLAISTDLKNWVKERKNPIVPSKNEKEWDSDFIAHPFVFKDNGKFYMLYDGSKKGDWLEEIGLAESEDLLNWKKYPKNPVFKIGSNWWEKRHVSRCCVFKEEGEYYLFYAGHDGQRERIGLASGKSLLSLKRFSKEPILDVGRKGKWDEKSISDPKIIKYKGKYLMFYSGINVDGIERVGVAESNDLLKWEKHERNPILDVDKNSWDKISATRADVKIFDGEIYLFYSGRKKFIYNIGMAKLDSYE